LAGLSFEQRKCREVVVMTIKQSFDSIHFT
jgi:hypothetical protein